MLGRKFDIPRGPGTYGSKIGRPPKKIKLNYKKGGAVKKKYNKGGSVNKKGK